MLHHHHRPVATRGGGPCDVAAGDGHRHALARGADGHRRNGIRASRMVQRLTGLHRQPLAEAQRLHAQLRLLLGEVAAGKPAGIADVVHNPHLHVALLGLERELLEEGEVLRRQVGRRHAAAGLRGHRMEAQALHGVQVARQALDGHRAIHAEIGLRPILRGRRLPRQLHRGCGRHLHLLKGILRHGQRVLNYDRGMLCYSRRVLRCARLRKAGWQPATSAHATAPAAHAASAAQPEAARRFLRSSFVTNIFFIGGSSWRRDSISPACRKTLQTHRRALYIAGTTFGNPLNGSSARTCTGRHRHHPCAAGLTLDTGTLSE